MRLGGKETRERIMGTTMLVTYTIIMGGVLTVVDAVGWEGLVNHYESDSDYRVLWKTSDWDNGGMNERIIEATVYLVDIHQVNPDKEVACFRRFTSESIVSQRIRLFGHA